MKFRFVLAVFSIIALQLFFTKNLSAQTISSNLTLGSRGAEVVVLQETLVADGFLVMPAGVSYGYFGPLTREAVAKWQVANGVSPALGYFGPISRSTLSTKPPKNQTIPTTQTPEPIVNPQPSNLSQAIYDFSRNSDSPAALGMLASRVMLFRAFPFEVRPGDIIRVDGSGFSKTSNKIYFSGSNAVSATSTDGTAMTVVVPPGLSSGEHELHVENLLGSSKNADIKIKIRVTDSPQPPPQITSASISGDTVTVVGTGFTSSNNLFTTLGDTSRPISSGSSTLTFRLSDLSRYEQTKSFTKGEYKAALWIFVQNEHGMNKNPYQLEINI